MSTHLRCTHEIERLHDAFVDCYTGRTEDVSSIEEALAPDFEMVTPGGETLDRAEILEVVRRKVANYAPGEFDIVIPKVELIESAGDVTVCRYEEHQATPDGETGRVGTVVFRSAPDTPEALVGQRPRDVVSVVG